MIIAWQNYNRSIAEQHKQTAHGKPSSEDPAVLRNSFFRSNNFEEADAAVVHGLHYPFVVCDGIMGSPIGKEPGIRKKVKTRLYFLSHVSESADSLEMAQQLTYDVMADFISRYIHDQHSGSCGIFQKLDPEKMIFQQVGPLLQYEFGWRLDLEFIGSGSEFEFLTSNWNI